MSYEEKMAWVFRLGGSQNPRQFWDGGCRGRDVMDATQPVDAMCPIHDRRTTNHLSQVEIIASIEIIIMVQNESSRVELEWTNKTRIKVEE